MSALAMMNGTEPEIPVIDREHEALLRRFEQVRDEAFLGRLTPQSLLWAALRASLHCHFETEEDLMRTAAYPDAESHTAEHRAFRDQMDAIENEMLRAPEGIPTSTFRAIPAWFVKHRLDHDRPLREFLMMRATMPPCS